MICKHRERPQGARDCRDIQAQANKRALYRRTLGSWGPENTRLAGVHGFGATRSCASSCYACNTIGTHGGDAGHNPLSASGVPSERAPVGCDTVIWRVRACGLCASRRSWRTYSEESVELQERVQKGPVSRHIDTLSQSVFTPGWRGISWGCCRRLPPISLPAYPCAGRAGATRLSGLAHGLVSSDGSGSAGAISR